MLPSNQLSPSLTPYYWSPSHIHRRLRESTQKRDAPPSVEPCYFYESYNGVAYLDVELPGVRKCNIAVEVNGNNLCITGKRFRVNRDTQYRAERRKHDTDTELSVVYFLQMRLGSDVDAEQIAAICYEDGILTLAIPIKATLVTRKIPIEL